MSPIANTPHPHTRALLPLILMIPLALTACGSASSESAGTPSTTAASPDTSTTVVAPATPATPAEMILDDEHTPVGYYREDFYALFGTDHPDEIPPTDLITPPECAPFAFDTASLFHWGAEPRETTAVNFYTNDADGLILIKLETDDTATPAPVDTSVCGDITRENATELATIVTTYVTTPLEVTLDEADTTTAVTSTVAGVTLDGQSFDLGKVGETAQILMATTGDTTVTVVGSDPIDTQVLVDLANTQLNAVHLS